MLHMENEESFYGDGGMHNLPRSGRDSSGSCIAIRCCTGHSSRPLNGVGAISRGSGCAQIFPAKPWREDP